MKNVEIGVNEKSFKLVEKKQIGTSARRDQPGLCYMREKVAEENEHSQEVMLKRVKS